jgi:hypothetical protein
VIGVRAIVIAVGMVALLSPAARAADRQVRPFLGVTFAGDTTIIDFENAVGKPHATIGVNAAVLGNLFGVDVDLARTGGFFESGDKHLVLSSSVTTLTGNLVVAAPRRLSEYSLRLYLVAGGGIMRVAKIDYFDLFDLADVLPAFDVGVGALGFVTNKVGVSWEIRRFQSLSGPDQLTGLTLGPERLTFWRASMALVVRY